MDFLILAQSSCYEFGPEQNTLNQIPCFWDVPSCHLVLIDPRLLHLSCCAGGSAGIGKAAAFAFDANGCSVAVLGRRLERLDAVVR